MKLSGEATWTMIWLILIQMFLALSIGLSFKITWTDPVDPEDFDDGLELAGEPVFSFEEGELQDIQAQRLRIRSPNKSRFVFFIPSAPFLSLVVMITQSFSGVN